MKDFRQEFYRLRRKRINSYRIIALVIAAIVIVFSYAFFVQNSNEGNGGNQTGQDEIHFIYVGQGDSELILSSDGHAMLIDGGINSFQEELVAYITALGVDKLDYFIITHPHADHIGGADYVIEQIETENVIMTDAITTTSGYKKLLEAIDDKDCHLTVPEQKQSFSLGEGISFTVIYDSDYGDNLNNASIITKVDFANASALFTGDVEKDSEEKLIEAYGAAFFRSDILKVAHHGSSSSSCEAFLDAVSPSVAVISCGIANDYSHPHRETLEKLEERNISYYRTDVSGSISVIIDKSGKITVETEN